MNIKHRNAGRTLLITFATAACVVAVYLASSGPVVGQSGDAGTTDPAQHFDPLGKPPSEHTLMAIAEDAAGLPFEDVRDFDEAERGFIAEPDSWTVTGPAGNVVWDLASI